MGLNSIEIITFRRLLMKVMEECLEHCNLNIGCDSCPNVNYTLSRGCISGKEAFKKLEEYFKSLKNSKEISTINTIQE